MRRLVDHAEWGVCGGHRWGNFGGRRESPRLFAWQPGKKHRHLQENANRYSADVVVFDATTVPDRATYEDPFQYAVGIKAVVRPNR